MLVAQFVALYGYTLFIVQQRLLMFNNLIKSSLLLDNRYSIQYEVIKLPETCQHHAAPLQTNPEPIVDHRCLEVYWPHASSTTAQA